MMFFDNFFFKSSEYFLTLKIDFVSQKFEFGKRYEIDLRVIFDQWLKLGLGLDVEAKIQILKDI